MNAASPAAHFEALLLIPHDQRKSWGTVRAASPRGLLRKLGGDDSLTRCYRVEAGRRTRVDLAELLRTA